MIKKLLVLVLIVYSSLNANEEPKEIKYFINIHKTFKGVLLLDKKDKNTEVKYFNISSRDKIPFYVPRKEFSFIKLNNEPTLATLEVAQQKKRMVYNLLKLSPDEIEDADIAQEDIRSSAIIYNKENLPSEVLEKKPIHTIESLILSIFETRKIPKGDFYLYEPEKNMLIKVVFEKEEKANVDLGNKFCTTQTWVLKIKGRNRRLVRVYTNPYPIKVEAFSKKWAFVIAGSGTPKTVKISKYNIALNTFKERILDEYRDYNVKILSQNVETDVFDKYYVTKFYVSKKLTNKMLKKYLVQYTNENSEISYGTKNNSFVFKVDDDTVRNLFRQDHDMKGKKFYWKESMKQIKLKKSGKKNDEELLNDIYKKHYKKGTFKISDIEEEEGFFDNVILTFKLKLLTKLTNQDLVNYALKAMRNKYSKNHFANNVKFTKLKNKWVIYIKKESVANYACSNAIPNIKSRYKDKKCEAIGVVKNSDQDTKKIIDQYIARHYKDLNILGTKIEDNGDSISFKYLNDLSKVTHECR